MEKCAIQLGLPAVRNMNYIDPGLSNDTSLPRSITLDIHIAHFSTWINSGRTVEPLEAVNTAEFLDTLTMGAGNHELSKTFECKEGVLVSVIISCASKTGGSDSERECELDVWMDRTEFTHGLSLIRTLYEVLQILTACCRICADSNVYPQLNCQHHCVKCCKYEVLLSDRMRFLVQLSLQWIIIYISSCLVTSARWWQINILLHYQAIYIGKANSRPQAEVGNLIRGRLLYFLIDLIA